MPKAVRLSCRTHKNKNGRGKPEYTIYSLQVPEEIGRLIAVGTKFVVELGDEGIVFKPVMPVKRESPKSTVAPEWVDKLKGNGDVET